MADESNYMKREIDHFLGDIKNHLKRQDEILIRIEAQGLGISERLNQAEKDISELKWWKASLIWAWGLILTIALFLANKFL